MLVVVTIHSYIHTQMLQFSILIKDTSAKHTTSVATGIRNYTGWFNLCCIKKSTIPNLNQIVPWFHVVLGALKMLCGQPKFPSFYISSTPSFSLYFPIHMYKSFTKNLLLISTCWSLHLFCLWRDPTVELPVPRTH